MPPRRTRRSLWPAHRRDAMTLYARQLAAALKLTDWDIRLEFDEPSSVGSYADITPMVNQRRATIRFGDEFNDLDPAEVRQTVAHELLHCHLFATQHLVESLLDVATGPKSALMANLAVTATVEQAVDTVADAVAVLLPLPAPAAMPDSRPAPRQSRRPGAAAGGRNRTVDAAADVDPTEQPPVDAAARGLPGRPAHGRG